MRIRLECRHCDVRCCNYGVVRYVFCCDGKKKIAREDDRIKNADISGKNFQGLSR